MPNTQDVYTMNTMDMTASAGESEYDQEEALLQDEADYRPTPKRVYQNTDRTLIIMGLIGTIILGGVILAFISLVFGNLGAGSSPSSRVLKVPAFGDIGCEFPGEVISPLLEQNLTLLEGTLEIVTSGRAIGDIIFHTETEDELEYVRMDVSVQGPSKSDLQTVYTRVREGRYELQSPEAPERCVRYTLQIWLPKRLTKLSVKTEALTHLSFAKIVPDSSIYELDLKIGGDNADNLLFLPEARIANARYVLHNGFIVGTTMVYNSLSMDGNQAQTDVELVLMRDERSTGLQFHNIEMLSSSRGLHRVTVKNPESFVFEAHHESTEMTEMVLSYPSSFTGGLSMSAGSLMLGSGSVHTDITRDGVTYVGSRDGPMSDLRVRNDLGSVRLSFE